MAKSLQDILKLRQEEEFVGRENQLAFFEANLGFSPEDPRHRFIVNVYGQGGVGKTWLLRQFRRIAEDAGAVVACTDQAEDDVPDVLGCFAAQFADQGHPLKTFAERYKVYRQCKEEIEADPEAPQGFSAFLGRTLVRGGLRALGQIPGAGIVTGFVDEDAAADVGGEFATYVARKIKNKDEVRLVLEPVDVLTPLFLVDLQRVAPECPLALFFDTYERTSGFLDPWFWDLLESRHGAMPGNILLTIAGREELSSNQWASYGRKLIYSMSLDPFTEAEARDYLARQGITDERVVDVILGISGRLPLLVATLAAERPGDPDKVGDPSDKAMKWFLKWVEDPKQQQVVLDAALPRRLNRDVLAVLVGEEEADALFAWLRTRPFVGKRGDGWTYHDVVRAQMLRYKRQEAPKGWGDLHDRLAGYYEGLRDGLGLEEAAVQRDKVWQGHDLEALYHRLCQSPHKYLPAAASDCLGVARAQMTLARRRSEVIYAAVVDAGDDEMQGWGQQLAAVVVALDETRYPAALEEFGPLIDRLSAAGVGEGKLAAAISIHGGLNFNTGRFEEALEDWDRAIALTPDDVWTLSRRGVVYREMARYEDALADFDRALELSPDHAWALTHRGETYRLMERHEEALADLDRAVALNPDDSWPIAHRGEMYRQTERYEEALADLDRAIALRPNYAWALKCRGQAYRQTERYEEALADFDRALELDPDYAWVLGQRGQTYRQMSRYEEALADFDRAIELDPDSDWKLAQRGEVYRLMSRYEEALADFDRAIELDPGYAWAIGSRGQAYHQVKRYEEALADLDRAIELDPSYTWVLGQRGRVYRETERYEEALADFDRAIELDPDDAWKLAQRGEVYRQMARYEEALVDLDRALELSPDYHFAHETQGIVFRELKRYDEALKALDEAERTDSSCSPCCAHRGIVYRLMARYEEALADFDRALELSPDDAWALGQRGQAYRQVEQYKEALADFDRAIKLDPDSAWKFAQRGETYRLMARYEEALADFDRAIKLDSGYAWAIGSRGQAYRQMERYEEALADFDRAIELDPDSGWKLAQRGVTYRQMGRYEESLADFDRALELDPDSDWKIAGRGATYRQMSRYEEALADLDRAIELDPDDAWNFARRGETYQMMAQYEEALADFDRAIELKPEEDWYVYERAITQRAMGQMDASRAGLSAAIQIAEQKHVEAPGNRRNACNLALYRAAVGEAEAARRLYEEVLSSDVSPYRIRTAACDLEDFLGLFPEHSQARAMRDLLQEHLRRAG